ncbi:MAG: glycosyltransferase family 2 protein [Solirubrobacterales bacterium]|nr:glycosyltransferase family 2 protein [Solirubrobacterales bacterium]
MKFSLIMATVGRTQEIERYLASLNAQTYRDFELIIVDQNPDDRVEDLLKHQRSSYPILHLCSEPGVSRARNIGIEHATGEVIGFPDDDCWYPLDFLERIARYLCKYPEMDGISGRVTDEAGSFDARFDRTSGLLEPSKVWLRTAAVATFVRREAAGKIGGFDEKLGPGSGMIWGGGEDIEYALRAISNGLNIYYDPALVVFHPHALAAGYGEMSGRAYSYGAGIGRVWRKHDYPIRLVAYSLLRPVGGAVLALLSARQDKARYHWSGFRGRFKGWLSGK